MHEMGLINLEISNNYDTPKLSVARVYLIALHSICSDVHSDDRS